MSVRCVIQSNMSVSSTLKIMLTCVYRLRMVKSWMYGHSEKNLTDNDLTYVSMSIIFTSSICVGDDTWSTSVCALPAKCRALQVIAILRDEDVTQ